MPRPRLEATFYVNVEPPVPTVKVWMVPYRCASIRSHAFEISDLHEHTSNKQLAVYDSRLAGVVDICMNVFVGALALDRIYVEQEA